MKVPVAPALHIVLWERFYFQEQFGCNILRFRTGDNSQKADKFSLEIFTELQAGES
jgi:hypothetical protein